MIQISDLTLRIAGRMLIEGASVTVPTGSKTGFVGRNGTGKTTLFKAITGEMELETGAVKIPRDMRIGQVAQEAPGTDENLINIVLSADKERTRLLKETETETDGGRLAELFSRLDDIDAHSAQSRAARILAGLGFDNDAQERPAREFSGGWRMRVALAAVLFSRPDILLLDEPTNYLDLEGTLWLENYLNRYPGTVIIISHDRDLLNRAVSSIVHLEHKKLSFYRGTYDNFERQRAQTLELEGKARVKQEAKRKHMMEFVDRFRYKASKAKQAQSRIKALEKMAPLSAVLNENVSPIHFPDPQKQASSPIIRLENTKAGYGADAIILQDMDLRIDADDRIALLGSNGNGKSTFAKLLANRLEYVTGEITRADKLKIAMFAQHQLDDLHENETPVEHVRPLMKGAPESKVRARVAAMGLGAERMETKARDLSGGEKARLLLGLIAFDGPHLLILDEPTNHLDIDSRQMLVEALNSYNGAVILISHDRHLIEASVERLWIVKDAMVLPYDGDMESYRKQVLKGNKRDKPAENIDQAEVGNQPVPTQTKQQRRREKAEKRKALEPLKQKIRQAEKDIATLKGRLEKIENELATPGLFQNNAARGEELGQARSANQKKIDALEENWLEMSAEYEGMV
ncbi:MAG: ABC-F family ATP-binding cassette domain-containing protein [Hyphomicrobiales bacterium]|nr:ABC-F family ATP-binding cassette domain-containing protein [Hyphomicrobiales bacterium]